MPSSEHFQALAVRLSAEKGRQPFVTMTRRDVTDMLREVSNEPRTRIKALVAQSIDEALADHGLCFWPSLGQTEGTDTVRLFSASSPFVSIARLMSDPSEDADEELRHIVSQVTKVTKHAVPA